MSPFFHKPQKSAHDQSEWQNKRTEEAEKVSFPNKKLYQLMLLIFPLKGFEMFNITMECSKKQ